MAKTSQSAHDEQSGVLSAILQNAVDAIITIDAQGLIRTVNPATHRLFGYTESELLGNNVSLLMPVPFRDEHDGYMQTYLRTGVAKIIGIGREVRGQRKDGSTFPLHLAVSEFCVRDQRFFTGIVRDISDLKQAEARLNDLNNQLEHRVAERTQQLREAQAELVAKERLATLGQVAGGIAHEIRNPLNAVKSSAYYLLNAKNPSPEKTEEHLRRIDRQVDNINHVITALSDVARLPEPKLVPVDIRTLLEDVLRSVPLPPHIEVSTIWSEPRPLVWGDPLQLPLLFRNLIRNAQEAMSTPGTLTVRVEEIASGVCVAIEDTGVGIRAEDLPRIAEPLYSTKARGMGLGLAIARTIADKNRATWSVESVLGEGSRFSVVLERCDGPPKVE